jgi:hypothetical protein
VFLISVPLVWLRPNRPPSLVALCYPDWSRSDRDPCRDSGPPVVSASLAQSLLSVAHQEIESQPAAAASTKIESRSTHVPEVGTWPPDPSLPLPLLDRAAKSPPPSPLLDRAAGFPPPLLDLGRILLSRGGPSRPASFLSARLSASAARCRPPSAFSQSCWLFPGCAFHRGLIGDQFCSSGR